MARQSHTLLLMMTKILKKKNKITQTQQLGEPHSDGREPHSFGRLTKTEWNNMFFTHPDHHLSQFGV